jgi:Transposase IS4
LVRRLGSLAIDLMICGDTCAGVISQTRSQKVCLGRSIAGSLSMTMLRYFYPSERMCVDESIARWYGQGGHWINMGLPMYIAIDRKPENGCEIQNMACGQSGVMIRLKVVKTAEEEASNEEMYEQGTLPHGAQVLRSLVSPWANSDRIICANSYFASVAAVIALKNIGLRFIGVIKTATRRFSMAYLLGLELRNRGDRKGLIMRGEEDGGGSSLSLLLAFVWMDREWRYFSKWS